MDWVALSLLSALALASADAANKRFLSDLEAREMAIVYSAASGLLLLPWLLMQPWPAPPPAFWGWVAGLMPLELLAMLPYVAAIRDSPLALTVPYSHRRHRICTAG
jgi:drug/metabolite transporter (DMT)-like permease